MCGAADGLPAMNVKWNRTISWPSLWTKVRKVLVARHFSELEIFAPRPLLHPQVVALKVAELPKPCRPAIPLAAGLSVQTLSRAWAPVSHIKAWWPKPIPLARMTSNSSTCPPLSAKLACGSYHNIGHANTGHGSAGHHAANPIGVTMHFPTVGALVRCLSAESTGTIGLARKLNISVAAWSMATPPRDNWRRAPNP